MFYQVADEPFASLHSNKLYAIGPTTSFARSMLCYGMEDTFLGRQTVAVEHPCLLIKSWNQRMIYVLELLRF